MLTIRRVKRVFDIALSLVLLLLLSPLIAMVAAGVRARLGAPVLFRQMRPGLHAQPFIMLKFRTMIEMHGSDGQPLADERRLTPFGRFLRGSSLDELPELLNVLRGEMSLVGPRPLLMEYVPLYNEFQARRHEVRPGITGWAQINGRNALSWEEKFDLDIWYVENRTMWLDIRILALTVLKVIRREGVSAANEATMPAFRGTPR